MAIARWIGLGLLLAAGSASAQLLVVRSTGPSAGRYATGTTVASNATLQLRPGDEIVVMDGAGTRSLRGPGAVAASGPSQAASLSSSLGTLTRQTSRGAARIGAVRGSATGSAPSLYAIDVDGDGSYCVARPADATLWRADASAAREVTLRRADGRAATVRFAAGEASAPWPAALAPAVPTEFTATTGDMAHMLTVKPLSPEPKSFPELAQALADAGCSRQITFLRRAAAAEGGE